MWDRKDLKAKGKAAYRANRLMCIIAALLLAISSGSTGAGGSAVGSGVTNYNNSINNEVMDPDDYIELNDDGIEFYDESGNALDEENGFEVYSDDGESTLDDDDFEIIYDEDQDADSMIPPVLAGILVVIILIAMLIGIAVGVFLLNPLQVGMRKFFVDNSSNPAAGLDRGNIGVAFSGNYMSVVKSMFTTGLFTFLWTLLLIIPGIIKSYEWRLVPYIVSECPEISGDEARKKSSAMMSGSKWDAFVLDLSFLGWILLGCLTLGILNLVFVNPYKAATDAELYLALSGSGEAAQGGSSDVEAAAEPQRAEPEQVVSFDVETAEIPE